MQIWFDLLQVVEELSQLMKYYEKMTRESINILGLALSSRKNLCIHPQVMWTPDWFVFTADVRRSTCWRWTELKNSGFNKDSQNKRLSHFLPLFNLPRASCFIISKCTFWFVNQVSQNRDGKVVDSRCHSLTASFVRQRNKHDPNVDICDYFEVRFLCFFLVLGHQLHSNMWHVTCVDSLILILKSCPKMMTSIMVRASLMQPHL